MTTTSPAAAIQDGATVVITHRVRENMHAEYEIWMEEISTTCRTYPGHMDWQVIRPMAGITTSYTVVIRFDTEAHLLCMDGIRNA